MFFSNPVYVEGGKKINVYFTHAKEALKRLLSCVTCAQKIDIA